MSIIYSFSHSFIFFPSVCLSERHKRKHCIQSIKLNSADPQRSLAAPPCRKLRRDSKLICGPQGGVPWVSGVGGERGGACKGGGADGRDCNICSVCSVQKAMAAVGKTLW